MKNYLYIKAIKKPSKMIASTFFLALTIFISGSALAQFRNQDFILPTVSIVAPVEGSTVTGVTTLVANANDNVRVYSVRFAVDNLTIGEVTIPPYQIRLDTTKLSSGSHTLLVTARDIYGNQTSSQVSFVVSSDNSAPSVAMVAPVNGASVSGIINVEASASDNVGVVGVQFQYDGVNVGPELSGAPYRLSIDTTPSANGTHALHAIARDAAGNKTTSTSISITVANQDTTNPTVRLTSPVSGEVSGTLTLTARASDSGSGLRSLYFYVDGNALTSPISYDGTSFKTSLDTTRLFNGSHTLSVSAYDSAGNSASDSLSVNVNNLITDTTPPTISITNPVNGKTVSGVITVTASVNDPSSNASGIAGVQFRFDGQNVGSEITQSPYTLQINTTSAADGLHTLNAIARDGAGNKTTSSSVSILVNNANTVKPQVSLTAPANGANVNGIITLSADISDSGGKIGSIQTIQFWIDGQYRSEAISKTSAGSFTMNLDTSSLSNAIHVITVIVYDEAGNSNSVNATINVNNADTNAPTVSITSPANNANVSGTININASASDNVAVSGVQFKVDGNNLGAEDTTSPYSVSLNTVTLSDGQHSLTAVARDAAGNTKTSNSVLITVNSSSTDRTAPTVSITAPASGSTAGGILTISANASDNVGVVGVQFRLDGIDVGNEDTTAPFSLRLDTETTSNGAHVLTAVARDAAGNTTTSRAVPVNINNHEHLPPSNDGSFFVTHHDRIPNFAKNYTLISVRNGLWSDPSTWSPARVPAPTDIVLIKHTVSYDSILGNVDTIGIDVGAVLRFKTDQNTKLKVANLLVMPYGTLEVGTQNNPVPANLTAEIIIKDKPIDTIDDAQGVYDPSQFGTGILAINGAVSMHGAIKSPTFLRLAREPRAGDTTLELESAPSGWKAGDKIILPDTRQVRAADIKRIGSSAARVAGAPSRLNPQWEEMVIHSVSGSTLTLTTPLRFDHLGARDADGRLDFLPHVGNLSRNILIRSENPLGTRGHILLTGRAAVSVSYVQLLDMGRTTVALIDSTTFNTDGTVNHLGANQIGRYAFHGHHLIGPNTPLANGYQFTIEGNAFHSTRKWGIAIHNSHYGLIRGNVIYNADGAGIVTEDGSETGNVIERNFTVRNEGSGFSVEGRGRVQAQLGHDGAGFWFRSPGSYVRNNVAANARSAGFMYFQLLVGKLPIPLAQGNDTGVATEAARSPADIQKTPQLEFASNESYGSNTNAFEIWMNAATSGQALAQQIRYSNLSAWHNREAVIHTVYMPGYVLDGLRVRGDVAALTDAGESPRGTDGHFAVGWHIRNADIQGLRMGPQGGVSSQVLENSFLRNEENVRIHLSAQNRELGGRIDMTPYNFTIRNTRFQALRNRPFITINAAKFSNYYSFEATIARRQIFVEDYNGDPSKDFQVFFKEQRPSFIITTGQNRAPAPRRDDALQEGISNQENFDRYGLSLLGTFPSCYNETSYPEIYGYVCNGTGAPSPTLDTTPPSIPANLTATAVSSSQINLSWNASTDNIAVTGYRIYRCSGAGCTPAITGAPIANVATLNFSNTALTPNTSYTYAVIAVDGAGNTSTISALKSAITAGSQDSTSPTVSITSPVANATISGTVTIAATAADNIGVSRVEFFVDGVLKGSDTTTPYSYSWDTTNAGTHCTGLHVHTLTAKAYDAASNSATSQSVPVNVDPCRTSPPPPSEGVFRQYNPIVNWVGQTDITSMRIRWSTDRPATHQILYGTTPALGSTTTRTTAPLTQADVRITNLVPNTLYYYVMRSWDTEGNIISSPVINFKTIQRANSPSPTPLPDNTSPEVYNVWVYGSSGSTQADRFTVMWNTNELATFELHYGTTSSLGQVIRLTRPLGHAHVELSGLLPDTYYYFVGKTRDASGNLSQSPPLIFKTYSGTSAPLPPAAGDVTAPVIAELHDHALTSTSATLFWLTDEVATRQVEYGLTSSLGSRTLEATTLQSEHNVVLPNLQPDTTYFYRAISKDVAGNIGVSAVQSFRTPRGGL